MKCYICRGPLSGKQKKFCSQSCQKFHKQNEDKKRHLKSKPNRPKRSCLFCGNSFRPRGKIHKCCDSLCRKLLETKRKREIAKRNKAVRERRKEKQVHIWKRGYLQNNPNVKKENGNANKNANKAVSKPVSIPKKIILQPLSTTNSQYQAEIEAYKEGGGAVKLLPPQLNGRTPEVNVTNLSGWSIETLIGFGYEMELMDELSSISEVGDAN